MTAIRCLALLLVPLPLSAQDSKKLVDPAKAPPSAIEDAAKDLPLPDKVIIPEFAFAAQHGPFLLVGGREGARFKHQLFNLKDGSVAVTIDNADLGKFALSPDGNLVACMGSGAKGAHVVKVYDVKAKKVAKTVDIGKRGDSVEFIDAEKFFTVHNSQKQAIVWNIGTGKQVATADFESVFDHPTAVSPGGAWLVTADKSKITAVSTAGGGSVKVADVPKVGPFEAAPKALAFSGDGARLAAYFDSAGKRYILIQDLAAGASKSPVEIPGRANFAFRGPILSASPDGQGWLVQGADMLDGETGGLLWSVPEEKRGDVGAAAVAVNQVVSISTRDKKILAAHVPKDKVGEMRAIAKSGGDARDAMRGKLTAVDLSGAKKITVPLGGVAWSGALGTPPDASKLAARSFITNIPNQQTGSMAFSGVEAGVLAVEKRPVDVTARDKGAVAIHTFNLVTGQSQGTIALAAPGLIQSVAPDGSSVLVLDGEKQDRLDLFAADGKHLAAWKPYDGAAEADRKVKYAGIVDPKHVLSMSVKGMLVLWSVPEVKAVVVAEAPMLQVGRLTPDRKLFAALDGESLRLFDAATLEPRGDAPGAKLVPQAIAFNTAGTEVAALCETRAFSGTWVVQSWDAKTGQAKTKVEFPFVRLAAPHIPVSFQFAGPYFLIDANMLYDPAAKETAWYFVHGGLQTGRALDAPDERLWYAVGEGFDKAAHVVAAAMPGDELGATLAEVKKSSDFTFKPGSRISLKLDAGGDRAGISEKLKSNVALAAKASGHALGESGDYELNIKLEEKDKNETTEYRMFGKPGTISVHLYELSATATLIQNGQTIWKRPPSNFGMRQFFVRVPANETNIEEYLRKQMWEHSAMWARGLAIPRMLVRTPSGVVAYPGASTLTAEGAKMLPASAP